MGFVIGALRLVIAKLQAAQRCHCLAVEEA
jgi:hypothetical protein